MHDKVVSRLMRLSNMVKLHHWNVTVYSKHVASDILYKELDDQIDRFVEAFYGRYGRPKKNVNLRLAMNIEALSHKEFLRYLIHVSYDLKHGVLGVLANTDLGLSSIRDEMIASIRKHVYLSSMA